MSHQPDEAQTAAPILFDEIQRDMQAAIQRALGVEARFRELDADLATLTPESHDELQAVFGDDPPLALVAFDTPGIQSYVFAATRPIDIRGGSQTIADLTADESVDASLLRHLAATPAAVPASTVIYAGAGGGLLLVAASEADAVAATVEGILRRGTGGALRTITSTLPAWPRDLSAEPAKPDPEIGKVLGPTLATSSYAAALSTLESLRQAARSRSESVPDPIPSNKNPERCHVCGGRQATNTRSRGGDRPAEKLCPSCWSRWQRGRDAVETREEPETFVDLLEDLDGGDGSAAGHLAVLYADGANMGRAFQLLDSPARHRALSLAVDQAMGRAADAVRRAMAERFGDDELRLQTPISGGDDLVLILPAVFAFDAARLLIRHFESYFDPARQPWLTDAFGAGDTLLGRSVASFGLGIGVAVGEARFPVHFLQTYAQELLKSAKKAIHEKDEARSAVDYLVLRTGTPLSTAITRLRELHDRRPATDGRNGVQLTERPYTAEEFEALLDRLPAFRRVPPSQIHAVRREIEKGYELSRSFWRYQHARAEEKEERGWRVFRERLGADLAEVDSLLWRERNDVSTDSSTDRIRWSTTYLDALELLDYVAPREVTPREARREEAP